MQRQIDSRNSSHSRKCLIWWSAAAPPGSAPPPRRHHSAGGLPPSVPFSRVFQSLLFPTAAAELHHGWNIPADQQPGGAAAPAEERRSRGAPKTSSGSREEEHIPADLISLSSSHDLYMCLTLTHTPHWNIVTRVFMCVCARTCAAAAERQSARTHAATQRPHVEMWRTARVLCEVIVLAMKGCLSAPPSPAWS